MGIYFQTAKPVKSRPFSAPGSRVQFACLAVIQGWALQLAPRRGRFSNLAAVSRSGQFKTESLRLNETSHYLAIECGRQSHCHHASASLREHACHAAPQRGSASLKTHPIVSRTCVPNALFWTLAFSIPRFGS